VKGLLILLVLVIVASGVLVIVRGWMADRARRGPWRLDESSDGELLTLHAVRPGDEPLLLGSVPIGAQEFDSKLYELRAEARQKVLALNQPD
jgi:hypothetical protein